MRRQLLQPRQNLTFLNRACAGITPEHLRGFVRSLNHSPVAKPAKVLIKDLTFIAAPVLANLGWITPNLSVQGVTHNSIFADLLISDFTRRVCLFEIRNQTVKDPVPHRYTAKPDLVNSDQSRLSPEPGRTPAARLLLTRLSRDSEHSQVAFNVQQKSYEIFCKL